MQFQEQYADLQDEGVLIILRFVELVIRVGPPQHTPRLFKSLLLCSMRSVNAYRSHGEKPFDCIIIFYLILVRSSLFSLREEQLDPITCLEFFKTRYT